MDFTAWENVAFGYHNEPEYQKNALFMDNDAHPRRHRNARWQRFDVRPPNPTLAAKNFSGGNQQKIVVAREIERNPDLLLIGQPTRGVDIGAIEFIHKQIVALRDAGKAILLVSVELDEILSPVGPHRGDVRRADHGRTRPRDDQRTRTGPADGRDHRQRGGRLMDQTCPRWADVVPGAR